MVGTAGWTAERKLRSNPQPDGFGRMAGAPDRPFGASDRLLRVAPKGIAHTDERRPQGDRTEDLPTAAGPDREEWGGRHGWNAWKGAGNGGLKGWPATPVVKPGS